MFLVIKFLNTGAPTRTVPPPHRNIFTFIMYSVIMENISNVIKDKCIQILESERRYKNSELAYLRYMMRQMTQEDLAVDLNGLTMKELKCALAAGVPGKCMHLANNLLNQYKDKMEAYLDADGNRAHLRLDALDDEGLEKKDENPGV